MDNATNALYAALTVIFVVGTYGLALSLETIMEQWISFREWRMATSTSAENTSREGLERPGWRVRNPLTSRRPYKVDEEISSAT
jgi:hypothetical protein